jgi:hypothetical protein
LSKKGKKSRSRRKLTNLKRNKNKRKPLKVVSRNLKSYLSISQRGRERIRLKNNLKTRMTSKLKLSLKRQTAISKICQAFQKATVVHSTTTLSRNNRRESCKILRNLMASLERKKQRNKLSRKNKKKKFQTNGPIRTMRKTKKINMRVSVSLKF